VISGNSMVTNVPKPEFRELAKCRPVVRRDWANLRVFLGRNPDSINIRVPLIVVFTDQPAKHPRLVCRNFNAL